MTGREIERLEVQQTVVLIEVPQEGGKFDRMIGDQLRVRVVDEPKRIVT